MGSIKMQHQRLHELPKYRKGQKTARAIGPMPAMERLPNGFMIPTTPLVRAPHRRLKCMGNLLLHGVDPLKSADPLPPGPRPPRPPPEGQGALDYSRSAIDWRETCISSLG